MATRIETPALVVPAGTPVAAPVSLALYAQRAELQEIEIMVPPGPSGLVGFSFWHSSEQVIPAIRGTWIITDSETIRWPLAGYSVEPDWQIRAYNLDAYPHTLYVRVLLDDSRGTVPEPTQLLVIE
jgi:hypothetical protein